MRAGCIVFLLGSLALAQTPTLTPAPLSLTFTYQAGSDKLPAAQPLAVRASVGTPNYAVSIGGTNTDWLIVTPETGRMPAALSVRVNPSSLIAGKYTATVSVNVTTGTSVGPAVIPVTLTVSEAPATLSVNTTTLNFAWPPQTNLPQTLRLTTSGGPISYTAAVAGGTWLSVSPASGIALPGSPAQVQVSVDAAGLAPQDKPYSARITITASGNTVTKTLVVTVNLQVSSLRPEVSTIWPGALKAGTPATTLTVRGSNFYSATVIKIEGLATPLRTTIISSNVIWAVVPETSLASAGTLRIFASNPAPAGDSASVSLSVTSGAAVQAVMNVASGATGVASPGMIVSLYGDGIGPTSSAGMRDDDNDGYADTTVVGVSARVGGVPAPILLTSEDRVDIQIPFEISAGEGVPIEVVRGDSTARGSVRIAATSPGMFTSDGSGIGQAAAFNIAPSTGIFTINGQSTPAKPGDTVVLYLTGEGDYALSVSPRTGYLVRAGPTLPQVNPLPEVTIGGKAATVSFAGPIPGALLGILRINAVVPEDTALGNAVPVAVKIGSETSQGGVTLAIKK